MDVASGAAIAKRLTSCNKSARNRAVRLLAAWLPSPAAASSVSDADLLKIWKGLFYCVWHADKAPVQLELINRLASLLPSLSPPLAARYLHAFVATIRREWPGIDFLRLDKFYLLIRRFLRHLFLLLQSQSWDPDLVSHLISIATEKSLPADGVSYHFAEIFFDELLDFLPVSAKTVELLLHPFHSALQNSSAKVLVNKIKINVFDRLLDNGVKLLALEIAGDKPDPSSEVDKLGKIAMLLGFSKKFFDSASVTDTFQGNRKVLFGLHEGFLKLEKDLEKSGVQVAIEQLTNGNSVEDTNSVASESGAAAAGSEDQPPKKKRKKAKKADNGEKKSKTKAKKKKKSADSDGGRSNAAESNSESEPIANGNGEEVEEDTITIDEPIISNLQKQFEKVAAEAGMASECAALSNLLSGPGNRTVKKRKRAKSVDRHASAASARVDGEKSAKKVSFSMKNNLVWKPQSPLPPQSLRLPPSATPRGSALKKGLPPGPIKETPLTGKKARSRSSSGKKARKIKQLRKLHSLSL